jgi:predicted phosphodiesterase
MERLSALAQVDVLVCEHTHIPFHRILSGGRRVGNAGSRENPKGGNPEACHIVL